MDGKLGFSVCYHFADGFSGAGAISHSGPPVAGCDDEIWTVGNRTDDGQLIPTDGAESCKKPYDAKAAEDGHRFYGRFGVGGDFFQRDAVVKSHKLGMASQIEIAASRLFEIDVTQKG